MLSTTVALPLHRLVSEKPRPPSFRDVIYNRSGRIAFLAASSLSVASILLLLLRQPWSDLSTPSFPLTEPEHDTNLPHPAPSIPPSIAPYFSTLDGVVYNSFSRPSSQDAIADTSIRPITSHLKIPDTCLDQWISTGRWKTPCLDTTVDEPIVDLVYIWVNGSDSLHRVARDEHMKAIGYRPKESRFREHDELRYSFRSLRKATESWKNSVWHIVSADVADPNHSDNSDRRLGLVPQWLDVDKHRERSENGQPPVYMHHDSQLFRLTNSSNKALTAHDVDVWRSKVLPTFNSHAIESQLPNLDPEIVSENLVTFNDDQFLMLPLPPSAFHSALYGPVIRLDPALLVTGDPTGKNDGNGEWRALSWSNHLLNQRFGTRRRAYLGHNARSASLPLMHEASLAFGTAFAATPLSRFRGSSSKPPDLEVNAVFHAAHWIIERHREALLWSWVVAKWGGEEGKLDKKKKAGMWKELGGGGSSEEVKFKRPNRTSMDDVKANMLAAGLDPPGSDNNKVRADTYYHFVSLNGYAADYRDLPQDAVINRAECLGEKVEPAWDLFRRLLVEKSSCGDKIIAAVTAASGAHGLSSFLPAASPSSSPDILPTSLTMLPLVLPDKPPALPSNPRQFAIRLIHRYAYVLGDSPSRFVRMMTARQGASDLRLSDRQEDIALMCINDDIRDSPQLMRETDKVLRDWFQKKWPKKGEFER